MSTGGGTGGATAEGAAGARVARRGAIGGGVAAHPMTVLSMPRPRHSRRRRETIDCLPYLDVIPNDTHSGILTCEEQNLCHALQRVQHGRRACRTCSCPARVIRDERPTSPATSVTVHRHAATESFYRESCRQELFGFAVYSYTVIILASTIEDTVCSRQVHRHVLRYAKHLGSY